MSDEKVLTVFVDQIIFETIASISNLSEFRDVDKLDVDENTQSTTACENTTIW